RELQSGTYTWSWLWYIDSPAVIWTLHLAGLVVFFLLTIGLWSRVMSVLACAITLAYCHRLNGALFGLDQVNAMLATYLLVGPCGLALLVGNLAFVSPELVRSLVNAAFSFGRGRAGEGGPSPEPAAESRPAVRPRGHRDVPKDRKKKPQQNERDASAVVGNTSV